MRTFFDSLGSALGIGLEPKELTFLHISLRSLTVFAVALILVRLSDRRGLTKKSPFDLMLVVILAAMLARAINGSSPFFPTLCAAPVLVVAHRLLALACCRWPAFSALVKGRPAVLVRHGEIQKATMRHQQVSKEDLEEDMRLSAKVEDLRRVKMARLEVSGDVSFIMTEQK